MYFNGLKVFTFLTVVGLATHAFAYQREFGLSVEPSFQALPQIAEGIANNHLTYSPSVGVSFEYHILNFLSAELRWFYAFAVHDNVVGPTTVNDRVGSYYFKQSATALMAGARVDSASYLLPVTLSFSFLVGPSFFIQTERDFRDDNGLSYKLRIPQQEVLARPLISASVGISGRVHNQIRLGFEPALYMVPNGDKTLVGFGAFLHLTFLFFT